MASSGTGTSVTDGGTSAAASGATATGPDDSWPGSTVATEAGAGCANPTVQIDFSPMYSAYISGENPPMHNFQVPAVTDDGNAATWSSADPTQVVMVAQTFGTNPVLPGVMITLARGPRNGSDGAGHDFTRREADGSCGASVLTITPNTEDDWNIGNARYNDGVTLTVGPGGGGGGMMFRPDAGFMVFQPDAGGGGGLRATDGGSFFERDGGTACTNCHGPTATNGPYRTGTFRTPPNKPAASATRKAHRNLHRRHDFPTVATSIPRLSRRPATVEPTRSRFLRSSRRYRWRRRQRRHAHARPVYPLGCAQEAYETWHASHQWTDIDTSEQPGVICYLRALQPGKPKTELRQQPISGGGGRGPRDGGGGGAPRGRRDAGGRSRTVNLYLSE